MAGTPRTPASRAEEGTGRERARERERKKAREKIGAGKTGEGKWGSHTHNFRLKRCTGNINTLSCALYTRKIPLL